MNLHNFKVYLQVRHKIKKNKVEVNSQESTVHGIRYFVDGENAFHKFAWFVIIFLPEPSNFFDKGMSSFFCFLTGTNQILLDKGLSS